MNFDGKHYDFSGAVTGIADFTKFGEADRNRLLFVGIDVMEKGRSASFMHMNHSGGCSRTFADGLEVMDIKEALRRYDGLPDYYWNLLKADTDEFTSRAAEKTCTAGTSYASKRA